MILENRTRTKEELSKKIQCDIEAFFANDGHITELPFGIRSDEPEVRYNSKSTFDDISARATVEIKKIPGYENCLVTVKGDRYFLKKDGRKDDAIYLGRTKTQVNDRIKAIKGGQK